MGVDFYLHWEDQTSEEESAQITGFATVGDRGYIREAYGGSTLATEVFCPESFEFHPCYVVRDPESFAVPTGDEERGSEPGVVGLDALKARMPSVRRACRSRARGDGDYAREHYAAFQDLLALAERQLDAGKVVWIYNSY